MAFGNSNIKKVNSKEVYTGPYTLAQLKELVGGLSDSNIKNKFKLVGGAGTYGEGVMGQYKSIMDQLKGFVSKGDLTLVDYNKLATPILEDAQKQFGAISGGGSKAADAARNAAGSLFTDYATKDNRGFLIPTVPFSATQYAQLPDNVLPSKEDVDGGLISIDTLPSQKLRKTVVPTDENMPPPDKTNIPGSNTPPVDKPLLNPDRTVVTDETIINPPTYPGVDYEKITDLISGLMAQSQTRDQAYAEAEGKRQADQIARLNEQQVGIRSQRMADLTSLLNKQENDQFSLEQPNIFESMNSGGLLTSSALGEALARERANLNKATQNTLAQQALSDRDAELALMAQGLGTQQQFQTAGLQRNYSLADWQKEYDAAKALGATNVPQHSNPYQSALGGALGGGLLGSSFGGGGAAIGAGIGGLLGLFSGKKGGTKP